MEGPWDTVLSVLLRDSPVIVLTHGQVDLLLDLTLLLRLLKSRFHQVLSLILMAMTPLLVTQWPCGPRAPGRAPGLTSQILGAKLSSSPGLSTSRVCSPTSRH